MAIEVAVAGMGPRGREWVGQIRAHPAYELAAVADVQPEVLERAASGLGVPPGRAFARLEEALSHVRCDAVIVATPADRHVEPCEAALSRGIGLLVEKPFTLRLDEAVRLVAQAEASGVPLMVGQNYRYKRRERAARRVVRDGVLGRIGMVVCHYYHGSRHLTSAHAGMRNSVLWGPVVHHIDALAYLLDRKVTGVMAHSFTTPWGRLPDGASMQALLTLEGGINGVYSATFESSGHEFFGRGQEYYQRLVGERATLHVFHRWLLLCERGKRPRPVRRGPRPVTEEWILLDQLRRAILDGEKPDSSGRANLGTIAAVEACVRSAEERRWVNPQDLLAATTHAADR